MSRIIGVPCDGDCEGGNKGTPLGVCKDVIEKECSLSRSGDFGAWFHLDCVKMTQKEFKVIMKFSNLQWWRDDCLVEVRSKPESLLVEEIISKIKYFTKSIADEVLAKINTAIVDRSVQIYLQ